MKPERWGKVESIFHKALEADENRRSSVIEESCAGDAELRREVESLLAHYRDSASFIEKPAFADQANITKPPSATTAAPRPDLKDVEVGHYRIVEEIGFGGMGVVYKAEDTRLGRLVALKFLPEHMAADSVALERFRREARAASSLNHPNICTIYDIDAYEGREFIVMEYLDGQTLAMYMAGRRAVDTQLVAKLGMPIAEALGAAHSKGVIHRDIKPGNIFVTQSGLVKVLDFGVAKLVAKANQSEATTLTETHTITGTLPYMSPEQLRGENLDTRSDIYALGVVLYEIATGQRLYSSSLHAQLVDEILNRPASPPSSINKKLSAKADDIILKCLAKDPEDRYQTAKEIAVDLRHLSTQSTSGSVSARTSSLRTGRKVRLWLLTTVAALVLAYFLRPAMPPPSVTGTTQLTRDGEAKLELDWLGGAPPPLLTDGLRIYFSEPSGLSGKLMEVSTEGGDTVPIDLPFEFYGTEDIDPARPELLVAGSPVNNNDLTAGIWQVPIPAGQSRRLGNLLAIDATWTPDGTALYYSTGRDVFRANIDGSEPHKLFSVNGMAYWLRFSTDEKILRFSVYNTKIEASSLWEAWTDGSHVRQLLAGWNPRANECCGNWTSDGKYFIFEANRDGIRNLWVMREKGDLWRKTSREPMQLTVGEMNSQAPLPSKDGTKVFFIGATRHSELVRYDTKSDAFAPYLGGISAEGVTFSPDGKRIAYVSYPEGGLWVSNTDGSDRRELTFSPTEVGSPHWSPDGKQIAFTSREPGKLWQISVISTTNDQPKQLTSGDTDNFDPSWSPDGKSVAVGQDAFRIRGSHANALHIFDLGTGQIRDVPDSAELFSARWSPDGRYLLAISADFQKLVLYDFSQRKWEDLVTKPSSYPSWSHDGKCVYFNNAYDKALPVYRICLSDRKLQHIADLSAAGRLAEGRFGWWTGLGPDDSILATRNIGIEEIYALHTKFP